MNYETILFEVSDGVARLTLNRPERLLGNARAMGLALLGDKLQRELGRSEDYAEGVAAFTAKRTPKFTGR